MAVEYEKVTQEVLDMAQEIIDKYHPHLMGANIGFVFRSQAARKGDKKVLGTAGKVTKKFKPHLSEQLDFIIELASDAWFDELDNRQRMALLDHELCHCGFKEGNPTIKGHDFEEFNCIIKRHGLWKSEMEDTKNAFDNMQLTLFETPKRNGKLVAVEGWKETT